MQSKTIELPKNSCIYGIVELFKQIDVTSEIISDIKTNKSKIKFEKKISYFIPTYSVGSRSSIQKGEINFEGDGRTKIDINYKRGWIYFFYIFCIATFLFLCILLVSNPKFSDFLLIFMLLSVIFIILPLLARYSFNYDEKKFANQIFNYLSKVDLSDVNLSDEDIANLSTFKKISSKTCPNCKKIIPNESKFCSFCGTKI
ncbi:MAG: zinc ribbon domain-containing protein [Candidatus Helarchaeota archaeon]|nr:zinc ribbon domain-containing protein [Candidatus Helarchaeota archaeon]